MPMERGGEGTSCRTTLSGATLRPSILGGYEVEVLPMRKVALGDAFSPAESCITRQELGWWTKWGVVSHFSHHFTYFQNFDADF